MLTGTQVLEEEICFPPPFGFSVGSWNHGNSKGEGFTSYTMLSKQFWSRTHVVSGTFHDPSFVRSQLMWICGAYYGRGKLVAIRTSVLPLLRTSTVHLHTSCTTERARRDEL